MNMPVLTSLDDLPQEVYDADKKIHVMLKKIFTNLDQNLNGRIDRTEIVKAIESLD
jgi:hypothetical protein